MCVLIVIIVFILTKKSSKRRIIINKHQINLLNTSPNRLWLYWENRKGQTTPTHIKLCQESVKLNCNDIGVTLLTDKNIEKYLPNLRNLSHLSLPHKADYIRLAILNEYGGMWIDSDIIVYKSLRPLINKLKTYDFVGFGCNGTILKSNGFPRPSNWAMISRKKGILIERCLKKANEILDSGVDLSMPKTYHKIGRELLWSEILYLLRHNSWNYLHWSSIGVEQDGNGNKFTNERLVSNDTEKLVRDAYFNVMYNTAPGFSDEFLSLTRDELLNSDMLISRMYRKALMQKIKY